MKELVLGGARSGKSQYAEDQARATGKQLIYIATGGAGDDEMAQRIALHQRSRGDQWTLIEEPVKLAEAISSADCKDKAIVIDCLTLWLTNCLMQNVFEEEKNALLEVLPTLNSDIFIVSNEVGSGIVPLGELSRQFVDQSGWLHQSLAKICDRVNLIVAGLPLNLKGA